MSRKKSGRTTGKINQVSPRLPSNSLGMKLFFALMVLLVLTLAVITVNPGTANVLTGAVIDFGIELPEDEIAIDLPIVKIPEEPTPETTKDETKQSRQFHIAKSHLFLPRDRKN